MIMSEDRKTVIENIKKYAETGQFHNKAEVTDPVLTPEQSREITENFVANRNKFSFRAKSAVATAIARVATKKINKTTEIRGLEKIPGDLGGCIVTSNHFSPLENTVIRHMLHKLGRKKLAIVSQTSNFAMTGLVGFLMNYANTVPLSSEPRYLARDFMSLMKEKIVDRGEAVLLYPEQELWYNYRKPRPPKNGAYFYAAKLGAPIISCFVEIVDTDEEDAADFNKVRYVLHVLGVLRPDPEKTARENTEELAGRDYELKKECYESVYGKKLTYAFENSDVAGWKGSL